LDKLNGLDGANTYAELLESLQTLAENREKIAQKLRVKIPRDHAQDEDILLLHELAMQCHCNVERLDGHKVTPSITDVVFKFTPPSSDDAGQAYDAAPKHREELQSELAGRPVEFIVPNENACKAFPGHKKHVAILNCQELDVKFMRAFSASLEYEMRADPSHPESGNHMPVVKMLRK